jgi:hypothetical protein
MGLRCLLGHDFGETEVEREREEDGNEMVVTIREVETCSRCGKERVLSENKEVTSIRSAEEVGLDETGTESGETADEPGDHPASAESPANDRPAVDDGVDPEHAEEDPVVDEGESEPAATHIESAEGEPVEVDETVGADEEFEPPESPEEDDGVILDEEAPEHQREQWTGDDVRPDADSPDPTPGVDAELDDPSTDVDPHGDTVAPDPEDVTTDAEFIDAEEAPEAEAEDPTAWPEHDDVPADDEGDRGDVAWPEHDGPDEGFDAEPDDGNEVTDVSFSGNGLTPESNGSLESSAGSADGETAYVSREDAREVEEQFVGTDGRSMESSVGGGRTEFYCPNCHTTWPTVRSSMRPGDICPDCHRGYIGEREL